MSKNIDKAPSNVLVRKSKIANPSNFKGIFVPVFSCFKNDENCTLEFHNIDNYARWIKSTGVIGIMVNGIAGEGPCLSLKERKLNAEAWYQAALKHNLIILIQIGGGPYPNVLELAQHAERLGVHGVVSLPPLFYKPASIEQLLNYCKIVANNCKKVPFFYYYSPIFSGENFDMAKLCDMAHRAIPNFLGLLYDGDNLDQASRCLRSDLVIIWSISALLASAMLLGFETAMIEFANLNPKIYLTIYNAMIELNMELASTQQAEAIAMAEQFFSKTNIFSWVSLAKAWFNKNASSRGGMRFTVGPTRTIF